jgi:tetratricopeptide (TPR) repeat protein
MVCVLILVCALFSISNAAFAAEPYDPLVTIATLNMAISSISNIISSSDRVVLDQEYRNIINNLSVGSIADDDEILVLFERMMDIITNETLRIEEEELFKSKYTKKEQEAITRSLTGIRAYGGDPWSFLGSLLASSASAYFGYKDQINSIRGELDDSLWSLKKERVIDLNDLQKQLLTSSWRLLRKYRLPDEYRVTEDTLRDFSKALAEQDKEKALIMFAHLEDAFSVFPPFWYHYGKVAREVGRQDLAINCFDAFERVWRGVLRKDPFYVEVAKERILLLNPSTDSKEIAKYIKIIRDNSQVSDWMNYLVAGVFLYAIGEKEQAIKCVELNIAFESEREISQIVLDSMKAGSLNISALPERIKAVLSQEGVEQETLPSLRDEEGESVVKNGIENNEMTLNQGHIKLFVGTIVWSLASSPEGNLLAVGLNKGDVSVFNMDTMEEVFSVYAHPGWVRNSQSLRFTSDGQRLLSGGTDDYARLYDIKTGALLSSFPHKKGVVFVGFSSDESKIFTGSGEFVRIWDIKTGGVLKSFELEGVFLLSLGITCGAVSSKGDRLVVGHGNDNYFLILDDNLKILDVTYTEWLPASIDIWRDGEIIAFGDWDDNVTLYSAKGQMTLQGHDGDVNCVAISPDGTKILSGSNDDFVKLWDAHTGELLASFPFDGDVHDVVFSRDGTYAIAGGNCDYVYLWYIGGF